MQTHFSLTQITTSLPSTPKTLGLFAYELTHEIEQNLITWLQSLSLNLKITHKDIAGILLDHAKLLKQPYLNMLY